MKAKLIFKNEFLEVIRTHNVFHARQVFETPSEHIQNSFRKKTLATFEVCAHPVSFVDTFFLKTFASKYSLQTKFKHLYQLKLLSMAKKSIRLSKMLVLGYPEISKLQKHMLPILFVTSTYLLTSLKNLKQLSNVQGVLL